MGHVLLTRPIEDSLALQPLIEKKGYEVSIAPLLSINHIPLPPINAGSYDSFIATSRHGIIGWCKNYPDIKKPIYVVGSQTYTTAQEYGFHHIIQAGDTVAELINTLRDHTDRFLYLRGQDITTKLPAEIDHDEIITYQAVLTDHLPCDIQTRLTRGAFSHILFFSPRTANHFVTLVQQIEEETITLKGTKALCLSDSMVNFLQDLDWQEIIIAKTPNRKSPTFVFITKVEQVIYVKQVK